MKHRYTWLSSFITIIVCIWGGSVLMVFLNERIQLDFIAACERHRRYTDTWPLTVVKGLATMALAQILYAIWLGIRHRWLKKRVSEGE